jgi:hypothetical protein
MQFSIFYISEYFLRGFGTIDLSAWLSNESTVAISLHFLQVRADYCEQKKSKVKGVASSKGLEYLLHYMIQLSHALLPDHKNW